MALAVKNLSANAGDVGLIPGSGRSPEGGNGNPLQYSCLGNPTDRGTRWAMVRGVTKESDTTERLKSSNSDVHHSLARAASQRGAESLVKVSC